MQPLTDLQERLLAEIRIDNTLTNKQYADKIGSSEGSTQDMIAKLIKRGYIVKQELGRGERRKALELVEVAESVKEEKPTKEIIIEDIEKRKVNAKVRELESKYNYLLAEYEDSEKRFDTLLNIKEQVKIIDIEPILSQSKSEAIPIIQLSDWHFEEKVDPFVINGLNEYNLDIAAYRWNKCIQNSLKLVHKERQSSDIEQVVLWLGGDFITGYIHEELEEDNYLSPTQATRFAKEKIITAIKFYLQHGKFKKIIIPCNFGNHGRTNKKPRVATGYKNSYEWMMFNDIADYFAGEKRLQFHIPNGLFAYLNIFEKKCRFWHGDSIKYGGGIGGLTVPLIKAIHKYDEQTKADYNFMGHYHQLWQATKNCIVNGSGIGFSPYAQRIGASPEEPKQAFSLIDVKYGMTTKMEIYCK
jgi:DNA-binding MarR family transcriptional regulator